MPQTAVRESGRYWHSPLTYQILRYGFGVGMVHNSRALTFSICDGGYSLFLKDAVDGHSLYVLIPEGCHRLFTSITYSIDIQQIWEVFTVAVGVNSHCHERTCTLSKKKCRPS